MDSDALLRLGRQGSPRQVLHALRALGVGLDEPVRAAAAQTMLHVAAQAGNVRVVQALCNAGAALDRRDATGMTALHLAVAGSHEAVVALLLESGADAGVPLPDTRTSTWERLLFPRHRTTLDLAKEGALAVVEEDPAKRQAAVRIHERLDKVTCSKASGPGSGLPTWSDCLHCDSTAPGCAIQ
jgi:hypothetical protein